MNEYLSELYDWISSQDATFQGRRSREEFISKMQDDADYNQQMYTWISGVDATFKNRYTTDAFQTKTGLKKKDDSEPTSQEVATESITKEEKQPTLSDASESKFDYESFIDKDEEEAIYDLQSELTSKGYSVEETGMGDALLVTDNITDEVTEIDLQPISWLGKDKYRAEEIEKVKKLIQTPTDSRRALLSTNQLEAYTSDRASYLQDLKSKYPNFQFEYVQDPQRGGYVRISKGDAVGEFEVKRGTFEDSKQFTAINNFLYQNMTDEEASALNNKRKIDEFRRIEEDYKNINADIDVSMESAETSFYDKNYFKGLFKALEAAGVSVPEEARRELESGYTTTTTYNPITGSAETLVPMGSQEIKDGIQKYFGSDPATMEKIKQYNLAGTIAVRKQKIDRAKKLAIENYYGDRPDRESVKQIVLQVQKDLTDQEADIFTNIEMAKGDLQKMISGINQEMQELSERNPGVQFEVITNEDGVLQNIISSEPVDELEEVKNRIKNATTAYRTLAEKSKYELEKINSKSETVDEFMEAANRNYNLFDIAMADLKNAFTQLGGGMAIIQTLAEGAVEDITGVPVGLTPTSALLPADVKMKMIRGEMAESREKVEKFYKTKRTYDEAIAEGSKFEFGVRTFAEQAPNIALAIGTSGVGNAVGLSNATVSTLVATQFGLTSAGQKYDELTTRQEFGAVAEKALKELESLKGIISDDEYLMQKYELERALEDSKISSTEKTLSVVGTGLVEGVVTRFIGTVPNSIKVLKDLKAPTNFMDDILRSNYTAAKQAVKEFGKRTGGEIIEETSIDLLTQINDYAFLGDQIDLSSLDDVAVTSIITSGAMNTPSTAYSTIMTQTNVNRYKNKINSLTQEIGTLKDMLMDPDISNIQRTAIHNNISNLISGIAEQTTNMEGDALLMGADNIKEMLTLSGVRNSMLKKAGVENDDSYDIANVKIDNYLKSLDQDAAKKFTDQMRYIDNRRNQITQSINYEGAVDRVFGEKGTEIAKDLDPTLTPQQKYVEVYKQIRQEINDNALKEFNDAIQKQEAGDISDAEPAEGVQEMEEEVREPVVTERKPQTVSDLINRPVTLTELGGSKLDTPIEGEMYVEGQQVVVEDSDGNITEIGNVDEISEIPLEEMGIVQQESEIKTDSQGNIKFGEQTLVPDLKGIKRNKRGDVSRVVLRSPDGSRTVTLRGANAEEAAYQILLKEAQSPEQEQRINELLDQDEEFQNELRQVEAATKAKADTDTEQVIAEESVKSPEVTVEDAPDGTFLNIEMVAGKDGREMTQKEILDALPVDPLNVEVSGKTLVIQVPRELSGVEMMRLAKDTDQDAIPQLSNKRGVLHAQSQEKMDLYEGRFVPNLFIKPKKIIKDERPKAGNRIFNEPLKAVKAIADKYYKRVFKGERPKFEGVKKIDKEFAKRISDAFEAMKENPNDPEVKAAYEAMAKETMAQYQDFKDAGYTIEINNSEPYKNAQEMIDDLRDNKRMKIFSTESGFGDTAITDKQRKENPLLRDSGVKDVNGETLLVNDIFRAVHDFYGHAELGNGFGPIGEENAWNVHARMFSPLARRAMTTETRGQNSYVNFSGINDEAFKLRDKARRLRKEGKEAEAEALVKKVYEIMKFADQKVGLLPEEFSDIQEILKVKPATIEDEVQQLRELFKAPDQRKQVDNALKALSEIAPDVEIIVHESEQAYAETTGETGRKQKTAGTYDETVIDGKVKKTIHINPEKANVRTVAHEVFHAILLNMVKTDAEAQRITEAMMKAVAKVASPELKAYLDDFASNYAENIRAEEKLAELVGKLASEYDSLPKPTQSVIKRWLDRLAKMFGLKPFTDDQVIDVLNTIAGKVSRGETVTQEDLSSIQSNAKYVSQDEAKLWGTVPERKQVRTKPDPKKTVTAYKMFRVKKSEPGKLFPLFVKADQEVLMDTWLDAEVGELTKEGKVKSKIGKLAYRPGWHMGDLPIATHIGDKYDFKKGAVDKSLKKPTARSANHVWAEVEVAADVNWQEEANKRAKKTKAGKIIPRTAHITDRLPSDGYYRYKTNPNMTGEWLIGGSIKVTRVLTDDEVKAINDKAGVADLPRVNPINLQELGFDTKVSTDVEAITEQDLKILNKDLFSDKKIKPSKTDSKGNLKTPSKKSQTNLKNRKQKIIDGVKDQVVSGKIVSTSLPNKDDVHSSKEYVVGISSLEEMASTDNRAKDQYIKISKEVASYGISKTKNVNNFEDAKQVISEFKEVVKSNLKWLYDSVYKDVRDISKLWYDGANKISNDLVNQYGYTIEQVAGVMAVLSPQMDWFRNLSLGERVIDIYKNNQDSLFDEKMIEFVNTKTTGTGKKKKPLFKNKEEIISRVKNKKLSELSSKDQSYFIRVYDEVYNSRNYNNITPNGEINGLVRTKSGNPGKVGWGDFSTIEKAISVLNDGSIENISTNLGNQHKVRNFFNNISNPNDKNAITIDTHAVAAALLKPLSGKSKQVAYNFGGSSAKSTGMTGTYPVYADAYRELAKEIGILPREVQSITWEAGRGLFKAVFKANKSNEQKINDVWNDYDSGIISLKEAQSKIEKLAGGISTPVWYEYLSDDNIESLDKNSAALDQSKLDEEPTSRSRKQITGRPSIAEIIRQGKNNNISDAAIREYLKEIGMTPEAADRAVKKYNDKVRLEAQKKEGIKVIDNKTLKGLDRILKFLTSARAYAPKSMQVAKESRNGYIEANTKKAKFTLNKLEKEIKKYKGDKVALMSDLDSYLRGDQEVVLPDNIQKIAFQMRTHIDTLSKSLIESGAVSDVAFDDLTTAQKKELIKQYGSEQEARDNYKTSKENVLGNIGSYLTRSYEVYTNKNWKDKVAQEVVDKAKNYLKEQMRPAAEKQAKEENRPVETVLQENVDALVDSLLDRDQAKAFISNANDASKNLGILRGRKDIPAELRALMGEYTSPAMNYIISVNKVATLTAQQNFLNKMKEVGEGVFFFKDDKTKGFRTKIAAEGTETMSPLNGLYTSPEIAEALKGGSVIGVNLGPLQSAVDFYLKSVGLVKYNKTILSPGTHAKNFLGNMFFMLANGHIDPRDYYNAAKVVGNDLFGGNREDLNNKLLEYIEAGVINQSVTLRDLKDMMSGKENRVDSMEDFERRMMQRFNKPTWTKLKSKPEAWYQAEDDYFKILAYEANKARYSKALFGKPFDQLNDKQKAEVKKTVTEIVKNTLPNYDRLPEVRKLMRAVPLAGTFISFHIEAIRTAWNTLDVARKEIANPKTRSIGIKRLSGIIALIGLKAFVLSSLGIGDEDDELEKSVRTVLPPWSTNSSIVIESVENGVVKYRDLSASDPWGVVDRAFIAYMSGEDSIDGFINSLGEVFGPFVEPDILFNALSTIRGKVDKDQTFSQNADIVMKELYKVLSPGVLTSGERIFLDDKKSLIDLVLGQEVRQKKQGRLNEFIGQVSGYKTREVKVEDAIFFKFRDIASAGMGKSDPGSARTAASLYNRTWYKNQEGEATEEQLQTAYEKSNKAYKDAMTNAVKYYQVALKLGVTPSIIEDKMKSAGFRKQEIESLSQGVIPELKQKEPELSEFEKMVRKRSRKN